MTNRPTEAHIGDASIYCDGAGPHIEGEARKMKHGGGNLILCYFCWNNEIAHRQRLNQNLTPSAQFDLPAWETGEVYE